MLEALFEPFRKVFINESVWLKMQKETLPGTLDNASKVRQTKGGAAIIQDTDLECNPKEHNQLPKPMVWKHAVWLQFMV